MAEEDENFENEERVEEKPSSRFPWMEKILIEILRLTFFAIVAFVIIYFVTERKSNTSEVDDLMRIDREFENIPAPRMVGAEWPMDEMIINTADELSNHFVKLNIVVSYDPLNTEISSALSLRRSEIHSEIRKIVGAKYYLDLKSIENQSILSEEIKTKIQRLVGIPGVIDVFLVDFTVH